MVDLHTHILPGIDDGSRSADMSLKLIRMEKDQGVDTIVLTPHFYPWQDREEDFFKNREQAWKRLKQDLTLPSERFYLGAEFAWFDGVSKSSKVDDFKIRGTDLLLLEMPFTKWNDHIVEEVLRLNERKHMQVVLAHVDRYFTFSSRAIWDRLSEEGVLFQLNAEAFLTWHMRLKIWRMISRIDNFFLGSDCHNLTTRKPAIGEALSVLDHRFGAEAVHKLGQTEAFYFGEA